MPAELSKLQASRICPLRWHLWEPYCWMATCISPVEQQVRIKDIPRTLFIGLIFKAGHDKAWGVNALTPNGSGKSYHRGTGPEGGSRYSRNRSEGRRVGEEGVRR